LLEFGTHRQCLRWGETLYVAAPLANITD